MTRWSLVALPFLAAGAVAFTMPAAPPPTTHHVKMMQEGAKYRFVPSDFAIHPGDIVVFENVSGGPHNVVFDKDHIPAGAREVLDDAMPMRQGDLMGPFLTKPHETYTINFKGAPKGAYHYYCLPHRALGMVGVITVE
jgi:plastocyanin